MVEARRIEDVQNEEEEQAKDLATTSNNGHKRRKIAELYMTSNQNDCALLSNHGRNLILLISILNLLDRFYYCHGAGVSFVPKIRVVHSTSFFDLGL